MPTDDAESSGDPIQRARDMIRSQFEETARGNPIRSAKSDEIWFCDLVEWRHVLGAVWYFGEHKLGRRHKMKGLGAGVSISEKSAHGFISLGKILFEDWGARDQRHKVLVLVHDWERGSARDKVLADIVAQILVELAQQGFADRRPMSAAPIPIAEDKPARGRSPQLQQKFDKRLKDILQLKGSGLSAEAIAEELEISLSTVWRALRNKK